MGVSAALLALVIAFQAGRVAPSAKLAAEPPTPTVQEFGDTDRSPSTGYGWGVEIVHRNGRCYATGPSSDGPGGWGDEVPCPEGSWNGQRVIVETYRDGVLVGHWDHGFYFGPATDIDHDGDIDLADFHLMQLYWPLADVSGDGQTTLFDYRLFWETMRGPNQ